VFTLYSSGNAFIGRPSMRNMAWILYQLPDSRRDGLYLDGRGISGPRHAQLTLSAHLTSDFATGTDPGLQL